MLRSGFIRVELSHQVLKSHLHTTKQIFLASQAFHENESLPRITIPHKLVQSFEKKKYKKMLQEHKEQAVNYSKDHSNLVISCKRTQFNHYKGQSYSEFNPQNLASGGWKSKLSLGDYFTILPWRKNPALESEYSSFSQLNLSPNVVEALEKCNFIQPTNVQSQVIPKLLDGESVLCAAETGNGKTLAFLVPLLEKILIAKKSFATWSLNQPVGVIIAPSRELVNQIYSVAADLCGQLGITVDVKCGGNRTQSILREFEVKPLDLVIATPGILSKILSNKFYDLTRLTTIVMDEVDTLLDDSFIDRMMHITKKLKISVEKPVFAGSVSNTGDLLGSGFQVVLTGATMPRDIQSTLNEIFDMDSIEIVTTPFLNHILPHVAQKFVRLLPSKKLDHLIETLTLNIKRKKPTIVFCNKPDTVRYLDYSLADHGIRCTSFHADMPQICREGKYMEFQNGESDILVCTDLASRGLDTVRVKHIINYDFPAFISDYIHRSGRVGRVGSPLGCFILNYVVRYWDVDLLWRLESAVRKNIELDNVNANIKRKLDGLFSKKVLQKQANLLEGDNLKGNKFD